MSYYKNQAYRKELVYERFLYNLPKKDVNIIFFGSSHTLYAANPIGINNSFNYAIGGENFFKTYYKLKKLVENDKLKIKAIALEVDLHSFWTRFTEKDFLLKDFGVYKKFIPYSAIVNITNESLINIWIYSNFPVIGNSDIILYYLTLNESFFENDVGWSRLIQPDLLFLSNRTSEALMRYEIHFGGRRISETNFDYFIKTLEFAKSNNITVILIKYPVAKEYDQIVTLKNISKKDYYDLVSQHISSKLNESYIMLDYYSIFFIHPEYFANSDHLNEIGSSILSNKIYKDLKSNKIIS